jgi:hypothetical protein
MWNLAWPLALPVPALLFGLLYMWWRTHPRRPADTVDSVAEYQRFRDALQSAEHRRVG